MTLEKKSIQVFISYAREDEQQAKRLFSDLKTAGLTPWLDTECLLPGQTWEAEIKVAIENSCFFLILVSSNSVDESGYVNKEISIALSLVGQLPPATIFVIPLHLEDTAPFIEKLKHINVVNMYPSWEIGLGKVLNVIKQNKQGGIRSQIKNSYSEVVLYGYLGGLLVTMPIYGYLLLGTPAGIDSYQTDAIGFVILAFAMFIPMFMLPLLGGGLAQFLIAKRSKTHKKIKAFFMGMFTILFFLCMLLAGNSR